MAFWVALAAVLALGGAATLAVKSNSNTPQAPAGSQPGTPVCDSSMCDYQRFEQAPAADTASELGPLYIVP